MSLSDLRSSLKTRIGSNSAGPSVPLDLAQVAWIRPVLESRWPLFLARTLTLVGFLFTILVGLVGSPVGSHNFAIIFVWIAWWTALKLVFIPLGGRSWCSVCPLPMPGEWLQAGGIFSRLVKPKGLGVRWPRRLRGYWLQAGLFLVIGSVSAVTLTDPRLTAWILLALIVVSAVLSLVFERRAFCSYVCPIGGFTGIYAKTAPVELRVKSRSVCAAHTEKTCYTSCSWGLYPLALKDSSQCGLCMECLRVCPQDNIALNLRSWGSDLGTQQRSSRLDQALLALVMLSSALSFSAVFLGPWGWLKSAAYAIGTLPWLGYAAAYLALSLLILPGMFALAVWVGERAPRSLGALKREAANQSQVLLPLGLFAWIAFTISFAFPKLSYVLTVISDPFGYGWDLFGTAGAVIDPAVLAVSPILQVSALLVGLLWSTNLAFNLAGSHNSTKRLMVKALPVVAFCGLFTWMLLWLLVG